MNTQAKSIWQQVRSEMDLGHDAASIELLRQLMKPEPDTWLFLWALGMKLVELGKYAEAEEVLQTALAQDSQARSHIEALIAKIREKQAKFNDAEQWYLRSTVSNPSSTGPWICLGAFYSSRGRVDEAIQSFTRAVSGEGDVAEAHFNLALCYRRLGKYEKSIESCQLALGLSPTYCQATAVLEDCQRALAIRDRMNPQAKGIWRQMCSEMDQERLAASIELLRQQTKLTPRNAYAFELLGRQLTRLGSYAEAEEALQTALVTIPEPPAAVEFSIGKLREEEAKFDEAEQWYLRATVSNPSTTGPWICLGAFYSSRGRIDEAIQSFARAVGAAGDVDEAYFNLALCYRRLENYEKSIEFCQLALGLSPDYSLATRVLEDCQRALVIRAQNEIPSAEPDLGANPVV
jgi:tetratricopeptide (TPR) repeat protein